MSSCHKCGVEVAATAVYCSACGARIAPTAGESLGKKVGEIFTHIPHPHIARRKQQTPAKVADMHPRGNPITRFNAYLAVKITDGVGTMWCAYAFAALACMSLPAAIAGGTATLVPWIAQTFIQLVLLSIIIVGQKVAGEASDKRALDTYNDAEAVLHEALQIQQHLAAQDELLSKMVAAVSSRT
jgi:hypothetical protein